MLLTNYLNHFIIFSNSTYNDLCNKGLRKKFKYVIELNEMKDNVT